MYEGGQKHWQMPGSTWIPITTIQASADSAEKQVAESCLIVRKRGLTNGKERVMYSYTYNLGTPYGPVNGPYDDPDWVAYCTDKERYWDGDEDEEPYREPFAIYDP